MNGRGPALSLWEPAAGKDPARLQTATREATPRAVGAAPEAQSERARTPPRTRDKTRFRAATKLDRRREELPRQITHEMERCAPNAVEVDKTVFFFRFMTGEGARLAGEPRPSLGPSPRGRRRAKPSWRRGLDHGLELPSRHSRPEDRDRAGGRQRQRLQAGSADDRNWRATRAGALRCAARSRAQRRGRCGDPRGAHPPPRRSRADVHRLDRCGAHGSPGLWVRAADGSPSSSSARTQSSCSRTQISRPDGVCERGNRRGRDMPAVSSRTATNPTTRGSRRLTPLRNGGPLPHLAGRAAPMAPSSRR